MYSSSANRLRPNGSLSLFLRQGQCQNLGRAEARQCRFFVHPKTPWHAHAHRQTALPRLTVTVKDLCVRRLSTPSDSNKDNNNNNSKADSEPTKAAPVSWAESALIPDAVRPYIYLARADKPVGTVLLFWPCCWGVALAAPMGSLPDLLLMSKFLVGAFIMRGAGCTINDLWDKDFDNKVERTKTRPLASGALSVRQAMTFLAGQLSVGLAFLLTFNQTSIVTGMLSMPLVVAYPYMKRVTYFPQAVLGLAFNWGVWVGYTAVHDAVNFSMLAPLYASGVCWTLIYDTIYGYQDRKDDQKIGVKSIPLFLGDKPQWPLTLIGGGMAAGLVGTGIAADLSMPYYLGSAGVMAHMLWQIWTADIDQTKNLWDRFSANIYTGGAITASLIAGHIQF